MAATAAGGRIYAVGGDDAQGDALANLQIYDPTTNTWTSGAAMPTARGLAGVTSSEGRLYAIGGLGSDGAVDNVEAYDPTTNTWQARAPIPNPCSHPAIGTLANGQIIVAGGGPKPATADVWLYTPASNELEDGLARLPGPVIPTGNVLGNTISYSIGGFVGFEGVTRSVEAAVVHQ